MSRTEIPEGYKEVPVPKEIIIDPIESKLDRFMDACAKELILGPGPGSFTALCAAAEAFSEEETQLLRLPKLFRTASLIEFVGIFFPAWVAEKRKEHVLAMHHRATDVRAGLMNGRVSRPPHMNPPTMLIRA